MSNEWARPPTSGDEDRTGTVGRGAPEPRRLLVVSRDAAFVDELCVRLDDLEVVALTEGMTRHALHADSPIIDDVALVVLDGTISGRLRLRLYDRLRPPGRPVAAAVVFTRSGFPTGRFDGHQGVDLYLPPESTVREIAWWCGALVRLPRRQAAGRPTPATNRLPVPALGAAPSQEETSPGYGWVARAGLWGVAAALTALTFWHPTERAAIGGAIRDRVRSVFGAPAVFADVPALPDPAARQAPR